MTRGNMRELVRAAACCLLPQPIVPTRGLIDVSQYPEDTEVPWFARKVVCAKCGARGRHIDVGPNWKEQPERPTLTGKEWR
jgi:hypothetical protein